MKWLIYIAYRVAYAPLIKPYVSAGHIDYAIGFGLLGAAVAFALFWAARNTMPEGFQKIVAAMIVVAGSLGALGIGQSVL